MMYQVRERRRHHHPHHIRLVSIYSPAVLSTSPQAQNIRLVTTAPSLTCIFSLLQCNHTHDNTVLCAGDLQMYHMLAGKPWSRNNAITAFTQHIESVINTVPKDKLLIFEVSGARHWIVVSNAMTVTVDFNDELLCVTV